MKTARFLPLLITGILTWLTADGPTPKASPPLNIDRFRLAAYPVVHPAPDSVRILAYLDIPYYALQFLKEGQRFRSDYEASIVLKDRDGNQIDRSIWQNTVKVDDYLSTISQSITESLMEEYTIPVGAEYILIGEVVDLDTKNRGEKKISVDVKDYRGRLILFPPILLEAKAGEWGFGADLFPALNQRIQKIEGGVLVYVSGRVKPGDYSMQYTLKTGDGELVWEDRRKLSTKTTFFSYLDTIPQAIFDGIKFKLTVQLQQGQRKRTETTTISIRKAGITELVTDIGEAIDQMYYIMTTEERELMKNATWKKREELFRQFWKKRDPTPNTIHNELMEEYYKRVKYANEHFSSFQPGWRTDMGMVYILMGPPDDVERTTMPRRQNTYEIWYYYRINQNFVFVDESGFGEFRLQTPFFGFERPGW
jgi:GWxTD domain-containing protein